eukprot:7539916-Pyramimonas_sp.AAC.1
MVTACAQVVADTGDSPSNHKVANGWFSHGVLARALHDQVPPGHRMLCRGARAADWLPLLEDP